MSKPPAKASGPGGRARTGSATIAEQISARWRLGGRRSAVSGPEHLRELADPRGVRRPGGRTDEVAIGHGLIDGDADILRAGQFHLDLASEDVADGGSSRL